MSAIKSLKKYIESYGTTVTLSSDGKVFGTPYRAFIQPLRYKNKMYLMGIRSRVGWIDQSHYLYIGPAEKDIVNLPSTARIKCQNENFYIVKAENVHIGDNVFYNWAVIRAVVEEPTEQSTAQSTAQTATETTAQTTPQAAPQNTAQTVVETIAQTTAQTDDHTDVQTAAQKAFEQEKEEEHNA